MDSAIRFVDRWLAPALLLVWFAAAGWSAAPWPVVGPLLARLALFLPLAILAWRGRFRATGAAAFGLAATAGFVAVSEIGRSALRPYSALAEFLVTLAYLALVAAPLLAWWRGLRGGYLAALAEGLRAAGLGGAGARPALSALALAAPFAAPWVVIGSLGSSAQTAAALAQTLLLAVALELLLRGVVFAAAGGCVRAVVWSVAVGALVMAGLPGASAAPADAALGALAPGLLFGALRLAGGSLPAVMLLAFVYRGAPLLFIDPRLDPNLTITAAHLGMGLLALLFGGGLLLAWRRGGAASGTRAAHGPALAAGGLWLAVAALYIGLGQPGIHEDGFVIVLKQQADLGSAARIADRMERLRAVRRELIATAQRTQGPIRAELDRLGAKYRPYYLVNMIRVDGRPDLAARFAGRPDVARIDRNPNARAYRFLTADLRAAAVSPGGGGDGIEPSLERIGVPAAWASGARGQGVLVAGADTGYDWQHPALRAQYAGWDGARASHDYHWHDAWDDSAAPFDDSGHGTHTMGTILGDDGRGHRIGIAPAARWIGCRNMRDGLGNPAAYTECMEFFLAPYPHGGDPFSDGDPARAPMVVNNSWGCPDEEGCEPRTLELAMDHMRAAGILMVVSAGNDGPACSTVDVAPALYDSVLAVGALNRDDPATPVDEGEQIAPFSSRGPVTADGSGRVKPDISAPGVGIRSSVPGGGYARASGTSMAGPHVTGVAALVISAQPQLAGAPDAVERLLLKTARPLRETTPGCDLRPGALPNNTFGAGEVDAAAAVRAARQ